MADRFYDKENKYLNAFLKEYKHWILEVSYRQHTPGSFVIFSKNQNIEKISELSNEELIELKTVMEEIEQALMKNEVFKPDRFNYWQMGNKLHFLHFHGIPRYEKPRIFNKNKWIDEAYGKVPVWQSDDVADELVIQVRDAIKPYLS